MDEGSTIPLGNLFQDLTTTLTTKIRKKKKKKVLFSCLRTEFSVFQFVPTVLSSHCASLRKAWFPSSFPPIRYLSTLIKIPSSFLFPRLHSLSLSQPLVIQKMLQSLHWTHSRKSLSFLYQAAQNWTQHSKCGLNSAKYMDFKKIKLPCILLKSLTNREKYPSRLLQRPIVVTVFETYL